MMSALSRRLLSASALVGAAFLLGGCRGGNFDMFNQERFKPYRETSFFPDGRSARPSVPNTIPRGHLEEDSQLYTGKVNGAFATTFPFPVTKEVLERGQERFNIYCAVCHDRTGSGHGPVVQRGFPNPPTYHQERLRNAAPGYIFDVITNGFGVMYPYGDRLTPKDRWAVVAYIRALQRAQYATLADVPQEERKLLEGSKEQ